MPPHGRSSRSIGEELAGLGSPAPGIEHRRGGLVGKQLGRGLQLVQQPLVDRPQQEGRSPDPVGQGRAIEIDALPSVDLRLTIERKMVGILGHQHLGDRCFGRQATFDQPRRCRCLHHHVLAGPAGIFGTAHDQHPELGRHDVETLGDVFADPVQGAGAAGTDRARHVDHRLDPRQMGWQRATVRPAFGSAGLAFGRRLLGLGKASRLDLLGFLEGELELLLRQAFGAATKAMTLQFSDDLAQPLALGPLRQEHRLEQAGVVRKGGRRAIVTDAIESYSPITCDHFDRAGCAFSAQLAATGTTVRRGS